MKYLVNSWRVYFIIVLELFTIKQFYYLATSNTKADYIGFTVTFMLYLFWFCWFFVSTIKKTYKEKITNTMEGKNEESKRN